MGGGSQQKLRPLPHYFGEYADNGECADSGGVDQLDTKITSWVIIHYNWSNFADLILWKDICYQWW